MLHIATGEYWADQGLWVYLSVEPTCFCCLYNHCYLEHVLQDVRNHVGYFVGNRQSESDETKRGFLLLIPTGGRRVGFLVEVAFRLTNFSPKDKSLLLK